MEQISIDDQNQLHSSAFTSENNDKSLRSSPKSNDDKTEDDPSVSTAEYVDALKKLSIDGSNTKKGKILLKITKERLFGSCSFQTNSTDEDMSSISDELMGDKCMRNKLKQLSTTEVSPRRSLRVATKEDSSLSEESLKTASAKKLPKRQKTKENSNAPPPKVSKLIEKNSKVNIPCLK